MASSSGGGVPAPTQALLGVSPGTGPAAGGTTIYLSGFGFPAIAGVLVGGVPATGVVVVSGGTILAVTPRAPVGVAGAAAVSVVTSAGLLTLQGAFAWVATPIEAAPEPAAELDLAAEAGGALHAVFRTVSATGQHAVRYTRSTDGGQTWASPALTLASGTTAISRPRVGAGGTTVFAIWDETGPTAAHTLRQSVSTSSGASFGAPSTLVATGFVTPEADVAVLSGGTVIVAHRASGGTDGAGNPLLHLHVRRGPATATLTGPLVLVNGDVAVGPISVATSGTSGAALAWDERRPAAASLREIWTVRSVDGGATWATTQQLTLSAAAGEDTWAPAVALSATQSAIAFTRDAPDGAGGTRHAVLTWVGSLTGPTVNVSTCSAVDAQQRFSPDVTLESGGQVSVAWQEFTATGFEILTARSTDAGATFGVPLNRSATAGASLAPRFAAATGGVLCTAWLDDSAQAGVFDVLSY